MNTLYDEVETLIVSSFTRASPNHFVLTLVDPHCNIFLDTLMYTSYEVHLSQSNYLLEVKIIHASNRDYTDLNIIIDIREDLTDNLTDKNILCKKFRDYLRIIIVPRN